MKNFESFDSILLVSIGASIGAFLRFQIIENIQNIYKQKYKQYSILIVNILATFLLGYLSSDSRFLYLRKDSSLMFLFLSIGFLGSLSTFSSFMKDLLICFLNKNFYEFFRISFLSLFGSFFVCFLGYKLGSL